MSCELRRVKPVVQARKRIAETQARKAPIIIHDAINLGSAQLAKLVAQTTHPNERNVTQKQKAISKSLL
jgi:hypothetical protein